MFLEDDFVSYDVICRSLGIAFYKIDADWKLNNNATNIFNS